MKKTIRYFIIFSLFIIILAASLIYASTPDMIGISNLTNGELKSGSFEMKGVILNNGQASKVAVKVGTGPWEDAVGVDRFSYQVNPRHIVLGYENVLDPASGQYVETPTYGPYYGDLNIVIGAFDAGGTKVSEKTVNVTIIPEKPGSDIISGTYHEPINVVLKAAPDLAIYYTTDGTDPKTNGTGYTGAIYVSQDTVIKAVSKSTNNQYSETAILDLKINTSNPPGFVIQYYEDQAFTRPVPDPASLKTGTYYLKIVSDRKFSSGPFIDINAPGTGNDVNHANSVSVSDCVYWYIRIVNNDLAATGDMQETIKISGTDNQGNQVQNIIPINLTAKAAYLDTQPPAPGTIALAGGASTTNDPTPVLDIHSTGAAWMRLALSEAGLANAFWVEYAAQYDEFDISGGGNGNKTIWIEFKDRAGNIQTQHASAAVNYDNAILSFDIEYFSDPGLTQSLGNNPHLKEGIYYLKITANQDLSYNPTIQIDAEGTNNDVTSGLTMMFNPRIYYYTRTIAADNAAVGQTKEQVTIQGINPSNLDSKGAYTDTQAPGAPAVSGPATTGNLRPTWTWNNVAGATRYRYSFSDGSNWVETTAISFTPADSLTPGNNYTLYVQAGDKAGNWSPSGSFTTLVEVPEISVKQWNTTDIPNGTGSCDFGNVTLFTDKQISFTIENTGSGDLNLTGTPVVRIDGPGAASFKVINQPSPLVRSHNSIAFVIAFTPTDTETKNATVSIANNDTDENPYTFTVTGTGFIHGTLTLDTWTSGNISTTVKVNTYCFNAVPGKIYTVAWDDGYQGTGTYTADVKVSAYRQDLATPYFSDLDSGYTIPRVITAQDTVVYFKIVGYNASTTGSFALKVGDIIPEPVISLKQGETNVPNGGSYNFGNVALSSSGNAAFTIQNSGGMNLNLTGNPKIQISGADASNFTVTIQPSSPIVPFTSTYFVVRFTPTGPGAKTATISIANDDTDNDPYTFTITGTGTGAIEPLTPDAWNTGNIAAAGEIKVYSFSATIGGTYMIAWDDSAQGSGTYNGNVRVSAYRQNFITPYFSNIDSGYNPPKIITAWENTVNLRIEGATTSSTGSFAVKVSEIVPEPTINLKRGSTNILNGTGMYDFGYINMGSSNTVTFTIENTGTGNIDLSYPGVQIGGADASAFSVAAQPHSPVEPYTSTNFSIKFTPNSSGAKTATVSIVNNDSDQNPYTFTITGNGVASPLNYWIPGSISTPGEEKVYGFNVSAGSTYRITWDDYATGTGTYTANTRVSGYRQNLTTSYFTDAAMGYVFPKDVTTQDDVLIIKVKGFNNSTGSYALKVYLYEPKMSVKQGITDIPNGTGSYDYGNLSFGSSSSATFTVINTGNNDLRLTDIPEVRINGQDAASFMVTAEPSSWILPNKSSSLTIKFTPVSPGPKSATVSIASDDPHQNPYTFTVTGNVTGSLEPLPLDTWMSGNIAIAGEERFYSLNAVIGKDYGITWDDSANGSGTYTGNVKVTAYRKDLTTSYFNLDAGYPNPRTITAEDNVIYLKVVSYTSGSTGSYALKAFLREPRINVKQGTVNIPSGIGSYDFRNVSLCTTGYAGFSIENTGNGDLRLAGGGQGVIISGADAASFYITASPATTVAPNSATSFTVGFISASKETKTATITITSNDPNNSSYTFTVTGTGAGEFEPLTLDTWTPGNISTVGEVKLYSLNTIPGNTYAIATDDGNLGSGAYNGRVVVSAYRQDMNGHYFLNDASYASPMVITALDNIVYYVITGYYSDSTGNFAVKAFKPLNEATINLKQGSNDIPSGTGSYNFGNVALCTSREATFRIENLGIPNLNLTGNPLVRIDGADASFFSITAQPVSQLETCRSTPFTVKFTPDSSGTKTATVSIMSDDADRSPYAFTITGTGVINDLTLNAWTPGNISTGGEVITYAFHAIPGKPYGITWDDDSLGSGNYTAYVRVSAYRQDLTTAYFTNYSAAYISPRIITAQDDMVYIKIAGIGSSTTGSFALKAFLDEPVMNVKHGTTVIPNGGNYDSGNVALCIGNYAVPFTIENNGTGKLNLTDTPRVRISGPDAASFFVSRDASVATVAPNENITFDIRCVPTGTGIKTATVSIANNDPAANPYTFTITAIGTMEGALALDTWTTGNISVPSERKTYCINAVPGRTYAITWDDGGYGSGTYTCDVKVSAYRQDLTTTYFSSRDYGYNSYTEVITAQDNIIYISVYGSNTSATGSFALKAYIYEPVISLKQGTTDIPSGTGVYNFGNVLLCTNNETTFTVGNTGNARLYLNGTPYVQISGSDVSCFSVTVQPASSILPTGSTSFKVKFTPNGAGTKTAMITILNNDPDQNPYTFIVTGTGTGTFNPLTLENWTSGSISGAGEIKLYSFNATPGTAYAISWNESGSSPGSYTGDVKVSAFRQDLNNTYFSDVDSGYSYPQVITAQESTIYLKVAGNSSSSTGSFALLASLAEPVIHVKLEATDIPNGAGSYNFGPVTIGSSKSETNFKVENTGDGYLILTGTPRVRISGTDAASFSVWSQPYSPLGIGGYSYFYVKFAPVSTGIKTATVSIANDDENRNPYTFTITGYGAPAIEKALTPDSWTEGNIAVTGEEKYYSFNATAGKTYIVVWDDSNQGSGIYTGDIKVSGYRQDYITPYFTGINNGYTTPQFVTAQDNIVYLKVTGFDASSTGSFALKVFESRINLRKGTTNIPNGSGSYDYGCVNPGSGISATFTIQNNGSTSLNLTGTPKVQISGTDASYFSVTVQPDSTVAANGSTTFTIKFNASDGGLKTAMVSIGSDDSYSNPYVFTITGTVAATSLPLGAWTPGNLSNAGEVKTFYFNTTPGSTYTIAWDDGGQGTGAYNCNIKVSAYRQDFTTAYFSNIDSGYTYPQTITAQENIIYLKVTGVVSTFTGSFGLKAFLTNIKVKQGTTNIPNGTGSYNYGNVALGSNSPTIFTIQNTGTTNLNLTDTPQVQISGADAASFSVSSQPSSPVTPGGSTTFTVTFTPSGTGIKMATISLANDDNNNNPYTFTITGTGTATGEPLTFDTWTPQNISTAGEVKTYYFMATPGTAYAIAWDDSYQGSGTYACDVKVSAYRQNLTTPYFSNIDSGYTLPQTITAQESIVYIKVMGYSSSSTGTFALKTGLSQPIIHVKQGSTNIPSGSGSYNFGSIYLSTSKSAIFTIQNTGNTSLSLTGSPKVQISGVDASCFSVTTQPSSPVTPNGSTTFAVNFTPNGSGTKTATVSVSSNDNNNSPYTFTITGSGTVDPLTLDAWISGSLTNTGDLKLYYFDATPGKTYKILWDDSFQGSGSYTCDIKVSCYRQDMVTSYFSSVDSGFQTPQTITAQDNTVYIKVVGYSSNNTGSFALKIVPVN